MNDKNQLRVTVQGKTLVFETGKLAMLANGAVTVQSGDTIVMASACASKEPSPDLDFLPLRVDYTERMSSAGRTLGGFIKREGRPTERETLVCRLIDRPIRPMFPAGFTNEVQVLCYVLSYEEDHMPEPLAICAASAALTISDIPLVKPLGAVRVGRIDGDFIINPTRSQMAESDLDLLIAGTEEAILMIEGYCDFLSEEQVLDAIEEGHNAIKEICKGLSDWRNLIGKEKMTPELNKPSTELLEEMEKIVGAELADAFKVAEKVRREEVLSDIKARAITHFLPEGEEPVHSASRVKIAFKKISAKIMRGMVLSEKKRTDGRGPSDIRPITIEMNPLPRAHGSAIFTRGETQALCVATLGSESMGQRFEDLNGDGLRRFYLQYSFPPFSVGECGRAGPPGRREVGHGKLAERATHSSVPSLEVFPYTIRLESNILMCNGSSSMASVCGGCLAMMDAGVPITRPVSGIAMGLLLEGNTFLILSDILGVEDALGDMDFKITGDDAGITAFQMDIKVEGITTTIMEAALAQAREGRIHILQKMLQACPKHREKLSQYAPRLETIQVKPSKIGIIVGPGGKMIRSIVERTGAQIDINDDGLVSISASDGDSLEQAKEIILGLVTEPEIGKSYTGKIKNIQPFGAFVEILPGKEGLLHISEISFERLEKVEDVLTEGETITVKLLDVNDRGQLKLSRKALLPKPEKKPV